VRQLIADWFPPPQRGVGVGWFFACVLVPPVLLTALVLVFAFALFCIFATAGDTVLRADSLAFGREVKAVRVGMTREQLYGLGFFNLTDPHGRILPKPTRADPHPSVAASFPDVDQTICIWFDGRDRIAKLRVTGSGRCSR